MQIHFLFFPSGENYLGLLTRWLLPVFLISLFFSSCNQDLDSSEWAILPFTKVDENNPVLIPSPDMKFVCPVRRDTVSWEEKDVFNPAVAIRDDQVHMIYRAEDIVGRHQGTSRLGLAISHDGIHFEKRSQPVLYPDNDLMNRYEWEGGIEDPRIVSTDDGRYMMTYTAYDGKTARLCIASSNDLVHWVKHGLAFQQAYNGKYVDTWSKSGAIICRVVEDELVATRIKGLYWMYWGDKFLHLASSTDLRSWEPLENESGELVKIMAPRPGYFDSDLVEPGPPAILREEGILLIYNGRNYGPQMDPNIEEGTYSAGQALFDREDPSKMLDRSETNFFRPDKDYEIYGQVNKVVFLQGLVPFHDHWLLYYGTADSKIAVAKAPR